MFSYYCSNFDKSFTADKKGWWIAYKTDSCDEGAIHIPDELVPNGITSDKEAQKILEKVMDWEWENNYFYATARHYGYQKS
jgi:hypothetical protein